MVLVPQVELLTVGIAVVVEVVAFVVVDVDGHLVCCVNDRWNLRCRLFRYQGNYPCSFKEIINVDDVMEGGG